MHVKFNIINSCIISLIFITQHPFHPLLDLTKEGENGIQDKNSIMSQLYPKEGSNQNIKTTFYPETFKFVHWCTLLGL